MNQLLSIVIPVYNEQDSISEMVKRLSAVLEGSLKIDYEIIFVNDGSKDNTWENIKILHEKDQRIKGISFAKNFGHQRALTAGINAAIGDYVFMLDGDLQHPPELLFDFYLKLNEGYDIVTGKRDEEEGISWLKKMYSKNYYRLFNKLGGTNMLPGTSDFRLIKKEVADFLKELPENNKFYRALLPWSGYKIHYFSYKADKRFAGNPQYSFLKSFVMGIKGITSFSTTPLYFSVYIGIFFATLSFLYGIYSVYVKLILKNVAPGFTDIVASILFLGGLQLINSGISGIYIGKIVDQTNGRPEYIIKEKIGLSNI